MKTKTALAGLVCLALPLCIGCNATSNAVRGQSPQGQLGSLPAPQEMQVAPTYRGKPNAEVMHRASMATGGHNPQNCPVCQQGQGGAGQWRGWTPIHHHTYSYKPPKDLAYPPDNQPAAVVQYPYYTVKGPSDFFYGSLQK